MGESSPNTYGGECSPQKRKEMREEIHQGEQENDVKFTQYEKRTGVRVHRGKRKMVLGITMEKKKSHRGMRVLKKGQLNRAGNNQLVMKMTRLVGKGEVIGHVYKFMFGNLDHFVART